MTTPRKRRKKTPLNGVLSNGNAREAGKFSLKLVIYCVVSFIAVSQFGRGCAEEFIEVTMNPTLTAIQDNVDLNTNAVITAIDSMNRQADTCDENADEAEESIDELKTDAKEERRRIEDKLDRILEEG